MSRHDELLRALGMGGDGPDLAELKQKIVAIWDKLNDIRAVVNQHSVTLKTLAERLKRLEAKDD